MKTGKVWLVGAGPGDVGLFTLKGMETLQNAEVVVYDSLVGHGVLSRIPDTARCIMWEKGLLIIRCLRSRLIRFWWRKQKKDTGSYG